MPRRGNTFKRYPFVCEALAKLRVKNAILDGELICIDVDGVSVFNELMFRRGVPYFYAFDFDVTQWTRPLSKAPSRTERTVEKANHAEQRTGSALCRPRGRLRCGFLPHDPSEESGGDRGEASGEWI